MSGVDKLLGDPPILLYLHLDEQSRFVLTGHLRPCICATSGSYTNNDASVEVGKLDAILSTSKQRLNCPFEQFVTLPTHHLHIKGITYQTQAHSFFMQQIIASL